MAKQPRDNDATMDVSVSQLVAESPRDNDATMDVSTSQLVAETPAPAPPPPEPGATNDVSLWAYRVVGTDDFAPPERTGSSVRTVFVVLLVLAMLAGGAFVAYRLVH